MMKVEMENVEMDNHNDKLIGDGEYLEQIIEFISQYEETRESGSGVGWSVDAIGIRSHTRLSNDWKYISWKSLHKICYLLLYNAVFATGLYRISKYKHEIFIF